MAQITEQLTRGVPTGNETFQLCSTSYDRDPWTKAKRQSVKDFRWTDWIERKSLNTLDHYVVRFLNAVTAESEKLVAFINNIAVLNTAADILVAAPDIVDTWDPLTIEDELEANWREVKATINPFKEWMKIPVKFWGVLANCTDVWSIPKFFIQKSLW